MREGDSITEHLNAFNLILSYLALIDVSIEDEDKCIFYFSLCPSLGKI